MAAHEIIPNLWLGSIKNEQNKCWMKRKNITCDIHAMENDADNHNHYKHFLHIPVTDAPEANIFQYFHSTVKYIDKKLKKKHKILLHCRAGISRSATLVAAYLIWKNKNWSVKDSLDYIRRKRNFINPNPGFIDQLYFWKHYLTLKEKKKK